MSVQIPLFGTPGSVPSKVAVRVEEIASTGFDVKKLVESFEALAEAGGGVGRLRGFVLDLATRGRLVPQVSAEGSAQELLTKLAGSATTGTDDEADQDRFELPESWRWTTIGGVCSYIQRGKSPKYVETSSVPVVSQKCVQWKGFLIDRARFIDPTSLDAYAEERFLRDGDLLWNSTGHGTVGRVAVFRADSRYSKVVADSHVTVVRPKVDPHYLWCWIASPTVQATIDDLVSGTTKQTELATSTVIAQAVPLPPLSEQKRIVAKVVQLMALCDDLEARQAKKREVGLRLTKSALEGLTAAEGPEEFDAAWNRVAGNFNALFGASTSIDALRETIVWLATHGCLSRSVDRATGSELLDRIRTSNRHRWETTRIGEMTASNSPPRNDTWKAKYVPPVAVDSADTLVALIPHHWSCASLEELAEVIDPNPSHRYPTYTRGSIPLLSTREFRGRDAWDASGSNVPFVPPNVHQEQNERCRFSPRDLIMARKGRLGLARHAPPLKSFVFSHTVFVIKAVDEVEPDFLLWYLRLDRVVAWLRREMNDNTGVPTLGKATTERLPVPLPPLQEQKLIVARVEHLMKVCDALEAKLLRSEDRAAKLVEAVVREVAQ